MYYIIASGKKKSEIGKNVLSEVEEYLKEKNVSFETHISKYRGHTVELAKELSNKKDCKAIIAIGGDGTFFEVLNGMNTSVPIGFVPAGTGNDLVRTLNIHFDVRENIDNILYNEPKYIDYLTLGDRRAFNIIGTGFDLQLLKKEIELRSKYNSRKSYQKALIKTILFYKNYKIKFRIDGGEWQEEKVFMVDCCNGIWAGGMMGMCLEADPHDGYIDFLYVKHFPRIVLLGQLLKFQKKGLLAIKYTKHIRCKKVEIEIDPQLETELDGEIYNLFPGTIRIVHNELKYFPSSRQPVDPMTYIKTKKARKESL
jgi:YegS/Rv2252/BmrU family lipid kinase